MKILKLAFALMVTFSITAQTNSENSVINFTYYDIPVQKNR